MAIGRRIFGKCLAGLNRLEIISTYVQVQPVNGCNEEKYPNVYIILLRIFISFIFLYLLILEKY